MEIEYLFYNTAETLLCQEAGVKNRCEMLDDDGVS
jgi:hypothetical protein